MIHTADQHKANGYEVECVHSGQKRRYGDTYREYVVKTDKDILEVEEYCTKHVAKCGLKRGQYLREEREGVKEFGDHFRSSYQISKTGEGKFFYQIIEPYTD